MFKYFCSKQRRFAPLHKVNLVTELLTTEFSSSKVMRLKVFHMDCSPKKSTQSGCFLATRVQSDRISRIPNRCIKIATSWIASHRVFKFLREALFTLSNEENQNVKFCALLLQIIITFHRRAFDTVDSSAQPR